MNNKGLKSLLAVVALSLALFAQVFPAAASGTLSLQAYGVDTIAGYSTLLRSSRISPNTEIKFTVTKSDGTKVQINSVTDESGLAKADLYDYHTRKAGKYMVSATKRNELNEGVTSGFTVFPDAVSVEKSLITAKSGLAKADGRDVLRISVALSDQYGNPLEGHRIKLISSRIVDVIHNELSERITDRNGNAVFIVTSDEPGLSVFSAVDETSGAVLNARLQAAFMGADILAYGAGGDLSRLLPVVAAAEAGPLHHFEIGDIPENVQPGQSLSFSVTAKDSNGITVENYTGTVRFSATGGDGNSVNLPEDYTFKAEDLGTHLFSLGLSFTIAGSYTVKVTDVNNLSIEGEKEVTVGSDGAQVQQPSGANLTIVTPAPGYYGDNIQTVSGNAEAGSFVRIFDNDRQIGEVQSSSTGNYSFQTDPLADGRHEIYVILLDGTGNVKGTSDTVEITIDTTPPEVYDISLTPSSGIKPGTVIDVKVFSEENLSDAALIFASEIFSLMESPTEPGSYMAQVVAPDFPGEYEMDVILVDELNNEATYRARATITVSEEGGGVVTPIDETEAPDTPPPFEVPENSPPTDVFGVIAYGTKERVTLVWEAAYDDKNVSHYRIHYGLDPVNMDNVVDTSTAATTWYIPGLQNGKEYYFAVAAVDEEGLESARLSQVVSAIPFTLEVTAAVPDMPTGPLATADVLHGASIEVYIPPEMTKNGPGVLWLLGLTGLMSGVIGQAAKRRKRTEV